MDSKTSDMQPSAQEPAEIRRLLQPGSYYCTICGDLIQDLAAFRAHIEGPNECFSHGFRDCDPCKLKGIVRTFYTGDFGRAHGDEEELFAGNSEGDKLSFLDTLEQHFERYHPSEAPARSACQACKGRYRTLNGLLAHEKKKHTTLRIHPCKVCQDQGVPTTFETFSAMKTHVLKAHGFVYRHLKLDLDEMYGCPICDFRYGSSVVYEQQGYLLSHMRNVHGTIVPSEMDIAGMMAAVKGQGAAK